MKLDNIYSVELYEELYGNLKYFNQNPWNVAMSKKIAEEYEYFKREFYRDVLSGVRDLNEYYALLKLTLNGPLIYFYEHDRNK